MCFRSLICILLSAAALPALAEEAPRPLTSKWDAALYGFVEFDGIADSTQSFDELAGNKLVARPGSFAGDNGRTLFTLRNSRIGFKLKAPAYHGLLASAMLEMDFLGNQPPTASEGQLFGNPTFRIRHFNLKLETPYVDILVGQYWQLFGWQSYFHPNTVAIQGVPGQVYSRSPQVRLTRTFKGDLASLDLAVAMSKGPQRDSMAPDGQAGIKLNVNRWKGLHTTGSTGTAVDAMSLAVSGALRRFELPELSSAPRSSLSQLGWGVSVDALVPLYGATERRAWAATLNASYVRGTGIADFYTGLTGGVGFPATLADGKTYSAHVDPGLIGFEALDPATAGYVRTVDWQSFLLGLQLYLPPGGRWWISGNFSQMDGNADQFVSAKNLNAVFTQSRWADVNLFWDVTPAVRLGVEYSWFYQKYGDGIEATNHRGQLSAFFLF